MAKIDTAGIISIEEALETTGFGCFNYILIIFSGFVLNNVILESVGISFILPILECDFSLTYQQQGVLGAVGFIGIIASSHIWGFLADTTGRRKIMLPAILSGFLVTFISSFSPNFEILAVLRFTNGFLLSAGSATIFAYLGEFHCQLYRNRAILSAAFISAFSAIFFPVIAWIFINQNWSFEVSYINIVYKPWRSYIIACGVPGFLCSLILLYLPESPKFLLTAGKHQEAIAVIKQVYQRNTGGNGDALNYEHDSTCVEHLEISTFKHTIALELIYVTLLLCVSYAIGKFGRKPILFIILAVCGSCGILGLIINIPLVAIYLFVVFLCCGLATTVVNAIVVDIYPTNLRAMAVCISLMLGRIGSVTGSNVLGALIDTHCASALYSSAGALIIAGFLSTLLPNPKMVREKPIDKA